MNYLLVDVFWINMYACNKSCKSMSICWIGMQQIIKKKQKKKERGSGMCLGG